MTDITEYEADLQKAITDAFIETIDAWIEDDSTDWKQALQAFTKTFLGDSFEYCRVETLEIAQFSYGAFKVFEGEIDILPSAAQRLLVHFRESLVEALQQMEEETEEETEE